MKIEYPDKTWEMKGFTKEVEKLCKALDRTTAACSNLSDTLSEFIEWSDKCTLQWRLFGLEEVTADAAESAFSFTGFNFDEELFKFPEVAALFPA